MAKVIVYDTTLRDGEQAPGFSMTPDEKLRMGRQLERLGVDVLEVGFPASSLDDLEASCSLASEVTAAQVAVLARVLRADIDLCFDALSRTDDGRIHVFTPVSELHIREKLRTTPEQNLEAARDAIRYARNGCGDVQFGCEDASRSDPDYLCRIVEACIDAGAATIDIADTVGYMMSSEFGALISLLFNRVPNIDQATVAVHCHDDLGLAVANSLEGLRAGARQVECTVNGIGERAGNASLEEIVMCLATRGAFFGLETGVETSLLYPTSQTLTEITGIDVQPNKAIVGANAFSHEAGAHQHGILVDSSTYEIMRPPTVGVPSRRLVLGKHSGRWALRDRLQFLDLEVPEDRFEEFMAAFKQLARKHSVDDAALADLAQTFSSERQAAKEHPTEKVVSLARPQQ